MLATDVVDVVREVAATDPTTCDDAGLATLSTEVHRLRCWLDSIDAAIVARRRELATAGGRRSFREADARLSAVFDAAIAAERAKPDDGRSFDQLRADAFINLVTATPVPGARRPAEILILCDLNTMQHGLHETSVCETHDGQPLPPDVVRRLACEANITPIVLDGDRRVVDVGRAKRLATADQRRALRAMHQTCAAPDCPVRFGDCDIHHLREWKEGGLTNLENLFPLCSKHHHLIHERQWRPPARAPTA